MKKIKVFFFIDSLMVGGMHKQVLNIVKNLNKNLFDPIVCTHSHPRGGLKGEFEATGCNLYYLNWRFKFDPRVIYRLLKVLKFEKPDIVFITEPQNLFYFQFAKIFYNKKIIQIGSFRACTFWKGHLNLFYKLIDDLLVNWLCFTSKKVIFNSFALKKHYFSLLKSKVSNKSIVIHNGSDFNFPVTVEPSVLRKNLKIDELDDIIIMVARLDPWKDFNTLIKAMKIIVKKEARTKLIFLGDGELKKDIENMIYQQNIQNNIFILGEKTDVYNYINMADISVLSTNGEGFSNTILESMAFIKPVIATDVGGNRELLGHDNISGILIPPKSSKLFANAILNIIANRERGYKIGHSAQSRVHSLCDINKYIRSYEQLFMDLID